MTTDSKREAKDRSVPFRIALAYIHDLHQSAVARAEAAEQRLPEVDQPQFNWPAMAAELAGALEAVDDGGDNEWLGDGEHASWSLTGAERRRINAALARYNAATEKS